MTTVAPGACSLAIIDAMNPPIPEPTTTMSASSVLAASTTTPIPEAVSTASDPPVLGSAAGLHAASPAPMAAVAPTTPTPFKKDLLLMPSIPYPSSIRSFLLLSAQAEGEC